MKAKKLTELSLLAAVALIIFVIEMRIPNPAPIPGVKLGLANIVTVYAVYRYYAKEVAAIVLVRILLGSLFSGSAVTLLYSLAGGLLCLSGMLILRRVITIQYVWVCSVIGAILHNIGQISVALIITSTWGILAYLPFLLVSGCIAGFFTGLCAQNIIKRNLYVLQQPEKPELFE